MNKLWWNRIVDFLLWISICLMLSTGFIMRYRLPPGSRGGSGLSIWDWTRHNWGDLHTWTAYTVCVFVIIHLILHWQWLMRTAWPRIKWPVIAGLILGILLAASAWIVPVTKSTNDGHYDQRGAGMGWRVGQQ